MLLTITSTPSQNLVFGNLVYFAPGTFPQKKTERIQLKVNELVFDAEPHSAVPPNSIALNAIQRKSARVSLNASVEVTVFEAHPSMQLSSISFDVDFLIKQRSGHDPIDAEALTSQLADIYAEQIFSNEQQIVTDFHGTNLLLTVKNMELIDTSVLIDGTAAVAHPDHGIFNQQTEVRLMKSGTSAIRFDNLKNRATPPIINPKFNFESLGIGGLDSEFANIFRRAFASRIFPPSVVKKLGISHVKGILLFGPPGTGKTLMARQIGKMLNCHEPKVVDGPAILNKYVGQSEQNIRDLFVDAENEYDEKGDDSQLHLIIFDELDAICKQRGGNRDGTGVGDSVVNQLLAKIDGVNSLNNVLIIGMTNRKDLIDEALLRPGRFEVHMEIGLPDESGRVQIFKIHTKSMRENKFMADDISIEELANLTKNYTGAEIEAVVKSASSFALNRQVDANNPAKPIDSNNIKVTRADFMRALTEVRPQLGVSDEEFSAFLSEGLIDYGQEFSKLHGTCKSFVKQVKNSDRTNLLSLLLTGQTGSGKTTLASHLAVESGFPYVKIVSADSMVGYSESAKCTKITNVFMNAYKSPLSVIVLDSIERLIEYVNIGPRFSNTLLQTLLVLIKKHPPKGRKLLVIATTNHSHVLDEMGVTEVFNAVQQVPLLNSREQMRSVLVDTKAFEADSPDMEQILNALPLDIGIKKLMMVIEMARSRSADEDSSQISLACFLEALQDCGVY